MGSLGVVQWIIVLAILWGIFSLLRSIFGAGSAQMTCLTCGVTGKTKTRTPGSILIEIVLWLCFLVPGLIYSLWRHSARKQVCGSCGATTLVPQGSPAAARQRAPLPAPEAAAAPSSVATELTKLVELRDKGVLTEAEFAVQKAKLLGGAS